MKTSLVKTSQYFLYSKNNSNTKVFFKPFSSLALSFFHESKKHFYAKTDFSLYQGIVFFIIIILLIVCLFYIHIEIQVDNYMISNSENFRQKISKISESKDLLYDEDQLKNIKSELEKTRTEFLQNHKRKLELDFECHILSNKYSMIAYMIYHCKKRILQREKNILMQEEVIKNNS